MNYECSLSKILQDMAKLELHEDENVRRQSLETIRNWIKKEPAIKNCKLDAEFLLRFLRVKKFSVLMAQEAILDYLSVRQSLPNLCFKLDPLDPRIDKLLSDGHFFPLPGPDAEGRTVVFVNNKCLYYETTPDASHQTCLTTVEVLLRNEENQIKGFACVMDLADVGPKFLSIWTPSFMQRFVKTFPKIIPCRVKFVHIFNVPSYLVVVFNTLKPFFSKKMQGRLSLCTDDSELRKLLPLDILPKEYGGKTPIKDMTDAWRKNVVANREWLLSLEEMGLHKKWQNKRMENLLGSNLGMQGNFRKLDLD